MSFKQRHLCFEQEAISSNEGLNVVAGFSERMCRGSVIIWNNDTVDIEAAVKLSHIPFPFVDITEWRLDDDHPLAVSPSMRV